MVYICCVENCKKEADPGSAITFHTFPRNKKERKKWIDVVPGKVTLTSVICSLHFKPDDFSQNVSKRYLKRHAVPSIFPGVISKERKYLVVNQGEITLESLPETSNLESKIVISDVRTLRENESRYKVISVTPQTQENQLSREINIVTPKTSENELRRRTIIITPKTGENELRREVKPERKHYIVINQGEISLESFPETPDLEPPESERDVRTERRNALKRKVNSEKRQHFNETEDDGTPETLSYASSDDEPLQQTKTFCEERQHLVKTEDDGTPETLAYTSSDDERLQTPKTFCSVLTQTGPEVDIIKEEEQKLKRLKKILRQRLQRKNAKIERLKSSIKAFLKEREEEQFCGEDSVLLVVS